MQEWQKPIKVRKFQGNLTKLSRSYDAFTLDDGTVRAAGTATRYIDLAALEKGETDLIHSSQIKEFNYTKDGVINTLLLEVVE